MKFICLGYGEEKNWDAMSESDRDALVDECFDYDEELRRKGHWLDGGQALQSSRTAKTLRWKNGEVVVTDGPFAETKEQLGGLGVLEARDMDHAVELVSKHPGIRLGGPFEIRPVNEEKLERQAASIAGHRSTAGPSPREQQATAKFASFGYIDERKWEGKPKGEFDTMVEQCIAFDAARRNDGQWLAAIALQGVRTAKTVRSKGNKVVVTDGPFAETKEQLGGVVVLGLEDMNHAIEVLSTHPALRYGVTIEIRPIDEEMNSRWEAREETVKQNRAIRGKQAVV